MKKLVKLLVIAVALVFVAASCQKEGIYKPKQKIDRIYYSSKYVTEVYDYYTDTWDRNVETTGKYVQEVWKWDGNLLKGIEFYNESGYLNYTENYAYDGKRLNKIYWADDEYCLVEYEGNKISYIREYVEGEEYMVYEFKHDGKKISEFTMTYNDVDYKNSHSLATIFRLFIPNMDSKSVDKIMNKIAQASARKSMEYTFVLDWMGDNVHHLTCDMGADRSSVEYSYDQKINPYFGLFDASEYEPVMYLSKNNVVHYTQFADDEIDEVDYNFTYTGNYPETKSYTYKYNSDDYRTSTTYTLTYEYK